jgi:hypothetical protein
MIKDERQADPADDALLNSEAMNNPLGTGAETIVDEADPEQKGALSMTEGGDYLLEEGSCWITVGNLSVYVKKDDEGVSVDIYPLRDENSDLIAGTYALFSEAGEEEES